MHNVSATSDGVNNRLLVVQISLDKFELIIKFSESFLEWLQFLWLLSISNGTSNFVFPILKEI